MSLTESRDRVAAFLKQWNADAPNDEGTIAYRMIDGDGAVWLMAFDLQALVEATEPSKLDEIQVSPARASDPTTSHAAVKIATVRATSARGKILLAFARADRHEWEGLTAEGAVKMAELTHQRAPWKRVSDLKLAGLIKPTGARRKSVASGAEAEMLAITGLGRAVLKASLPAEYLGVYGPDAS